MRPSFLHRVCTGGLLVIALCMAQPSLQRCLAETSPLDSRNDPAQQAWLREQAKRRQEQFRLKVALPQSALGQPTTPVAPPVEHSPEISSQVEEILWGASVGTLLLLIVLVLLPRLAPEFVPAILKRLFPALDPAKRPPQVDTFNDEAAFAEFLKSFRAGPLSSARPASVSGSAQKESARSVEISVVDEPNKPLPFYIEAPGLIAGL